MTWDFPVSVAADGKKYQIRNRCDYRVVLDVLEALNDEELPPEYRIECALRIFYKDFTDACDMETLIREMLIIINYGEEENEAEREKESPRLMDWSHDFKQIAPPVSRILGYDVRTPRKYTHWYTFLAGYFEIGECTFSTVVSIRNKRMKGKKLEKWEEEFLRDNRKLVELPHALSAEEEAFLLEDW